MKICVHMSLLLFIITVNATCLAESYTGNTPPPKENIELLDFGSMMEKGPYTLNSIIGIIKLDDNVWQEFVIVNTRSAADSRIIMPSVFDITLKKLDTGVWMAHVPRIGWQIVPSKKKE